MKLMVVVVLMSFGIYGNSVSIVFAGIDKNTKPLFSERYNSRVRDRLKVDQNVQLMDIIETRRLVKKLGLRQFTTVPRSLVDSIRHFTAENTLVIWARMDNYSVKPQRRYLIGAKVVGNVSLVVSIYSFENDKYMFVGTAGAHAEVGKPLVWFRKVAEVTHISSQDREKLADKMSQEAARNTIEIIDAITQSMEQQPDSSKTTEEKSSGEKPYERKTIQDIETQPSRKDFDADMDKENKTVERKSPEAEKEKVSE